MLGVSYQEEGRCVSSLQSIQNANRI
ncbi:hypothetical protein Pint_31485 [Pistacia integerrima]|uniref:Uncharacterized protein n=1 Tax=Pistacia integerrima TaxID=434235 RepID=A0ACC0XQI0_9ROSI|nr:hypothetical protein Pint_31485 [Pistacia integerrima]